ncbi:hypothetical protein X975_16066, partial [Stegodyphus mimosarum]
MGIHLLRSFVRNPSTLPNGMFYILRMCNQEVNRGNSTGSSDSQSKQAVYGAPEYFGYNEYSFFDIHAAMEKYRLPR